jgi:hypothetical protein
MAPTIYAPTIYARTPVSSMTPPPMPQMPYMKNLDLAVFPSMSRHHKVHSCRCIGTYSLRQIFITVILSSVCKYQCGNVCKLLHFCSVLCFVFCVLVPSPDVANNTVHTPEYRRANICQSAVRQMFSSLLNL